MLGFLRLFGKGPLSADKIAKVAKLAANPFAQPDVRMREMQRLMDDDSDLALRGVLKRFTANAQGHIADEDEKKWLEDALVERGTAALPALRDYIVSEEKLTYALKAFRRIAGEAAALTFFVEVLGRYGPDDYRATDAKLQLVGEVSDHLQDPQALGALTPFLRDHSDDVRWAVLDALERASTTAALPAAAQAACMAPLCDLVTNGDVSQRIARRAAELLDHREWALPAGPDVLVGPLQDEFFLDKKRFVRRRTKKSVA